MMTICRNLLLGLAGGALVTAPVQAEPVKIGASLPITGGLAINGQKHKDGYELCVDLINQAGGLLGGLAPGLLQELGGLPRGGRAPLRGGLLGLLHQAPGLGLGVLGDALDQPALAHSLIPMAWLTISRMFARPATGPRRSGTSTMRGKLWVNM